MIGTKADVVAKVWCVFYDNGDEDILWTVWTMKDHADNEAARLNGELTGGATLDGPHYIVEEWDVHECQEGVCY